MEKNAVSLHSSVVGRANLRTYIEAAKRAGFSCIEPTKTQLNYFLQAGQTPGQLRGLLGGLKISAVSWLQDIERQGAGFAALMEEAEQLFDLAAAVGSEAVEILNGPLDWRAVDSYRRGLPYSGYMGLQGMAEEEQQRLMVRNLQALADLAAQFKLSLFFEPLCWTPVPSLREALPLVRRAGRENLKVVVDFYHNYVAGVDAEFLSRIEKELILGVHICNSRRPDGRVPCEEIFRDVGFYEGPVPVKEWVQAVQATGFEGWWAYETYSKREAEEEVYGFAGYVYGQLQQLLRGGPAPAQPVQR